MTIAGFFAADLWRLVVASLLEHERSFPFQYLHYLSLLERAFASIGAFSPRAIFPFPLRALQLPAVKFTDRVIRRNWHGNLAPKPVKPFHQTLSHIASFGKTNICLLLVFYAH